MSSIRIQPIAASLVAITLISVLAASPLHAAATTTFQFSRNLQLWETGPDVLQLQQFLNAQGFLIAQSGPGSLGDETTLFGPHTYGALVRFQAARGPPPDISAR
ncbi:peptidoglycan-binding domain-containing protein [Bradyrhizobium sp. SZCCHNRI1009]|uniref:peptidoglycan-binding domain-containing protein n=1 Tax=Bradyrhizobium sp. SZCCHNRI1009 TaxID=3057277 RepID=UPI0039679CF6